MNCTARPVTLAIDIGGTGVKATLILLNYDMLYLGGGNAAQIQVPLPENVQLASNDAGLTGGSRLWDDRMWNAVPVGRAARGGRLP